MRRARRSRIGRKHYAVVTQLVELLKADTVAMNALRCNDKGYVFGKLLNKFINDNRESVIDMYVDEDAKDATWYAINIVNKELR